MSLKGHWPIGGRRLTSAQREAIITAWQMRGREAADKIAADLGLHPWYAYKLVRSRGLDTRPDGALLGKSHTAALLNG